MLSNSPLSRTLTDARKRNNTVTGLPGDALVANLLTGIRVADVSEAQMDHQLQKSIGELYSGMGGKDFTRTYLPEDIKARMSPEQLATLEKLKLLERQLRQRRTARAAQ